MTKVKVRGTAIVAGVSRNKIRYTEKELGKGSLSLEGVSIIKDHDPKTDNAIGKVESAPFKNGVQSYEGWVKEDGTGIVERIRDQRVKVSIGAMVDKLVKVKESDDELEARGIRYMELSTTPTPGIAEASIETAEGEIANVTESFDFKQLKSKLTESEIDEILKEIEGSENIVEEDEKMPDDEVKKPVEELPEEKVEEPKADTEPKEEPKAEEPKAEEPAEEEKKEEPVEEPAEEKKDEAAEMIKGLVKENLKLSEKLKAMEEKIETKEKEAEKMETVKETKTQLDVEEKNEFDSYVFENVDAHKAFYKMPKHDGTR